MEIPETNEYFETDWLRDREIDESEVEEASYAGRPGYRFFPLKRQLFSLGLFREDVDLLAKTHARVLDLGCGNGSLVNYLCEQGINAEGIGSTAPIGERFMRQDITAVHPAKGCIPRKTENYDFVFIHSIPRLNVAFSSFLDHRLDDAVIMLGVTPRMVNAVVNSEFLESYMLMCEGLRVLKSGGTLISSPALNKLEEKMHFELDGKYTVEHRPSYFGLQLCIEGLKDGLERYPGVHGHRTFVYRN